MLLAMKKMMPQWVGQWVGMALVLPMYFSCCCSWSLALMCAESPITSKIFCTSLKAALRGRHFLKSLPKSCKECRIVLGFAFGSNPAEVELGAELIYLS